jgi:ATP-dependent HslUV protease ATP-binding subunit HslU
MERLLETVSFEAADQGGQKTVVDAAYVERHVASLAGNEDLARYIL